MIKVIACGCKNEYQDERYGNGNRIANKTGATVETYRCTVCGKETGTKK